MFFYDFRSKIINEQVFLFKLLNNELKEQLFINNRSCLLTYEQMFTIIRLKEPL